MINTIQYDIQLLEKLIKMTIHTDRLEQLNISDSHYDELLHYCDCPVHVLISAGFKWDSESFLSVSAQANDFMDGCAIETTKEIERLQKKFEEVGDDLVEVLDVIDRQLNFHCKERIGYMLKDILLKVAHEGTEEDDEQSKEDEMNGLCYTFVSDLNGGEDKFEGRNQG